MQPLSRHFKALSGAVVLGVFLAACSNISQVPPSDLSLKSQSTLTTVASGLNNPRGLTFTPNADMG